MQKIWNWFTGLSPLWKWVIAIAVFLILWKTGILKLLFALIIGAVILIILLSSSGKSNKA